jgi:hypothetical protein
MARIRDPSDRLPAFLNSVGPRRRGRMLLSRRGQGSSRGSANTSKMTRVTVFARPRPGADYCLLLALSLASIGSSRSAPELSTTVFIDQFRHILFSWRLSWLDHCEIMPSFSEREWPVLRQLRSSRTTSPRSQYWNVIYFLESLHIAAGRLKLRTPTLSSQAGSRRSNRSFPTSRRISKTQARCAFEPAETYEWTVPALTRSQAEISASTSSACLVHCWRL